MTAIAQTAQSDIATRLLAGVSVPDTPLISRAIEFARERSEPYLFNHVMRSWLLRRSSRNAISLRMTAKFSL
jgi:hypothetical protein